MNVLILSPGRRVDIVNYFKKELHKIGGEVYTLDMNPYSAALYEGDKFFVVEKDFNNLEKYIDNVVKLALENNVNAILTLIDPELVLLCEYKYKFIDKGIIPIVSRKDRIEETFDKFLFSTKYQNVLPTIPTFINVNEVIEGINSRELIYPIFVKDRNGSGSSGIGKINCEDELNYYKNKQGYIFQPFLKEKEFGVDVYIDMISGKITSLFIKEKISMRAGETDKAVSLYRTDIVDIINNIEKIEGFVGPIDVDIFEDKSGKLYVNEINPRFGGGYPHAYNCGLNFINLIINNLQGIENKKDIGNYQKGIAMMKYNALAFRKVDDLAKN